MRRDRSGVAEAVWLVAHGGAGDAEDDLHDAEDDLEREDRLEDVEPGPGVVVRPLVPEDVHQQAGGQHQQQQGEHQGRNVGKHERPGIRIRCISTIYLQFNVSSIYIDCYWKLKTIFCNFPIEI